MAFSCSGELSIQRSGQKSSASDPKMDSSRCRTHAFIPTIVPAGMCTSQMTAPSRGTTRSRIRPTAGWMRIASLMTADLSRCKRLLSNLVVGLTSMEDR